MEIQESWSNAVKILYVFYYLVKNKGKEAAYKVAERYIEDLEQHEGYKDVELQEKLFEFIQKVSECDDSFESYTKDLS